MSAAAMLGIWKWIQAFFATSNPGPDPQRLFPSPVSVSPARSSLSAFLRVREPILWVRFGAQPVPTADLSCSVGISRAAAWCCCRRDHEVTK